MVWNFDRFGRNDFLGEVNVGFDHHSFDDPTPKWHKLQDRVSKKSPTCAVLNTCSEISELNARSVMACVAHGSIFHRRTTHIWNNARRVVLDGRFL